MGEIKQIDQQQAWTAAIKTNDELILKQLYVQNYQKVEQYILMNNGSIDQAKDIYQEAFIAVWRNVKSGKFEARNESALQGYLYQIAKNKWTDFLRSAQYKKTGKLPAQWEGKAAKDIEEVVEKDTKISAVMGAFKQLGQACQELLSRFYFEKRSVRDIAQSLQIEEASARNKKYRCMQKLKELAQTPN